MHKNGVMNVTCSSNKSYSLVIDINDDHLSYKERFQLRNVFVDTLYMKESKKMD